MLSWRNSRLSDWPNLAQRTRFGVTTVRAFGLFGVDQETGAVVESQRLELLTLQLRDELAGHGALSDRLQRVVERLSEHARPCESASRRLSWAMTTGTAAACREH